jgi:hypothetical protein
MNRRNDFFAALDKLAISHFNALLNTLPFGQHADGYWRVRFTPVDLSFLLGGTRQHWGNILANGENPTEFDLWEICIAVDHGFEEARRRAKIRRRQVERMPLADKPSARNRAGNIIFPIASYEALVKESRRIFHSKIDLSNPRIHHVLEQNGLLE